MAGLLFSDSKFFFTAENKLCISSRPQNLDGEEERPSCLICIVKFPQVDDFIKVKVGTAVCQVVL